MSKYNTKTLMEKIREKQAASKAQGDNVSDIKDPSDAGTKSIPVDSDASNDKQNVPGGQSNTSSGSDALENNSTPQKDADDPAEIKPKDGNREDEAGESKLKGNEKIATAVKNIRQLFKKEASSNSEENKSKEGENKEASKKQGQGNTLDKLTPDLHVKIAKAVLELENGREIVEKALEKRLNKEAANKLINDAVNMEKKAYQYQMQKQAYLQKLAAVKQAQKQEFSKLYKEASDEDKKFIEKAAKAHQANLQSLKTREEKIAYEQGMGDAAMAAEMDAQGADMMAGMDDISIEELAMILEEMIAAGEITPEEAEEILMMYQAEMGGAAVADPAMMDPAMMDPAMAKVANVMKDLFPEK